MNLLDLNDDCMEKVMEHADFKLIVNLRKTCRDLRNFLDDKKCDCKLPRTHIYNTVPDQLLVMHCGGCITYRKTENGCAVDVFEKTKNVFANTDYSDLFFNDLKINLSHQKSVMPLLEVSFRREEDDVLWHERLMNTLANNPSKLKVEKLVMTNNNKMHVPSVIPYLDPKHLTTIRITCRKLENSEPWKDPFISLDIGELVELEQFKAAKNVFLYECTVSIPVEKLFHLSIVRINLGKITFENFKLLKEEFFKKPHMKNFLIACTRMDDYRKCLDYLGPQSKGGGKHDSVHNVWFSKVDGSDDVVRIEMYYARFFALYREAWTEKLAENCILY